MAAKKPVVLSGGDTRSDAWQRFERAVDAGIKSGPKHRTALKRDSKAKKNKSSKKRP